jgi:hypothetical protein
MSFLRIVHLYLSCFFAPLLILFLLSGLWQTYGLEHVEAAERPSLLALLGGA